jgi:hypothetical protein
MKVGKFDGLGVSMSIQTEVLDYRAGILSTDGIPTGYVLENGVVVVMVENRQHNYASLTYALAAFPNLRIIR